MAKLFFNYYKSFHCIASKCKHSCCEKWQIDIDKKSLRKYKKAKGNLKKELISGVDFSHSCYKMNNGRCAFLDSENLCKIIKDSGEKFLCQVCADHPRVRNYFFNRVETGLSLACEEAGRIILNSDHIFLVDKKGNKAEYKGKNFSLKFREKILSVVRDSSLPYSVAYLKNFSESEKETNVKKIIEKILTLEIMNESFIITLNNVKSSISATPLSSKLLTDISEKLKSQTKNLLLYLIYRHCSVKSDKVNMQVRVKYVVDTFIYIIYMYIVRSKTEGESSELFIDVCREYSAEIEYSDDNLYEMYDFFEEELYREKFLEKKI